MMHIVTEDEQKQAMEEERGCNPSDIVVEFTFRNPSEKSNDLIRRRYKIYPEVFQELLDILHSKRAWSNQTNEHINLDPVKRRLSIAEMLEDFIDKRFKVKTDVGIDFQSKDSRFIIKTSLSQAEYNALTPTMKTECVDWLIREYPSIQQVIILNDN